MREFFKKKLSEKYSCVLSAKSSVGFAVVGISLSPSTAKSDSRVPLWYAFFHLTRLLEFRKLPEHDAACANKAVTLYWKGKPHSPSLADVLHLNVQNMR